MRTHFYCKQKQCAPKTWAWVDGNRALGRVMLELTNVMRMEVEALTILRFPSTDLLATSAANLVDWTPFV
jgi:hypothetical protein